MQLNLAFLEVPNPSTSPWRALDEAERLAALETLARLIAQAAAPEARAEDDDDD